MKYYGWIAGLLTIGAFAVPAQANPYGCCPPPGYGHPHCYGRPVMPNACTGGYYVVNPYGMMYGPNHYLRPPFPPFNGMLPAPPPPPPAQNRGPAFLSHPYIRSPRDFFMIREVAEELDQGYRPPALGF